MCVCHVYILCIYIYIKYIYNIYCVYIYLVCIYIYMYTIYTYIYTYNIYICMYKHIHVRKLFCYLTQSAFNVKLSFKNFTTDSILYLATCVISFFKSQDIFIIIDDFRYIYVTRTDNFHNC